MDGALIVSCGHGPGAAVKAAQQGAAAADPPAVCEVWHASEFLTPARAEFQAELLCHMASPDPDHRGSEFLDLAIYHVVKRADGSECEFNADGALVLGDGSVVACLPLGDSDDSDQLLATETELRVLGYGRPGSAQATDELLPVKAGFAKWHHDDDGAWLWITGAVAGGHSGGPVLTSRGEVVGWVAKGLTDAALVKPFMQGHVGGGIRVRNAYCALRPINAALPHIGGALRAGAASTAMADAGVRAALRGYVVPESRVSCFAVLY
jgi:hypothetical protein